MTISKEQIESASILLNTDGQFFGDPCKIVFMTSEQLEIIRTVLKERLEWMNPKNIITLPTAQPSEALAALERLRENACYTGEDAVDWSEEGDSEIVTKALQRNDVPHGFVLVPIEPTNEMLMSGAIATGCDEADVKFTKYAMEEAHDTYKAMIAAAPKPTEGA